MENANLFRKSGPDKSKRMAEPHMLQWREKSVESRHGRLNCATQAGVAAWRKLQSARAHLCPRDALGRRQQLLRLRENLVQVGVAARAGNRRFGWLSALHAHTKAPCKMDSRGERLRNAKAA